MGRIPAVGSAEAAAQWRAVGNEVQTSQMQCRLHGKKAAPQPLLVPMLLRNMPGCECEIRAGHPLAAIGSGPEGSGLEALLWVHRGGPD